MQPITVALDGPAGVGKSTVAKKVAQALRYQLVDTGAIYRAVALVAERQGIASNNENALAEIAKNLVITFRFAGDVNHVFVDGEDVSEAIRTEIISQKSSLISALPLVRKNLLELQRQLAKGGAVLEGRDIGTVVCPFAEVKFFLDASSEERAKRRFNELQNKQVKTTYEEILAQVKQRDDQDRNRAIAPLKPADDAVILDCTHLSIAEVVKIILDKTVAFT